MFVRDMCYKKIYSKQTKENSLVNCAMKLEGNLIGGRGIGNEADGGAHCVRMKRLDQ